LPARSLRKIDRDNRNRANLYELQDAVREVSDKFTQLHGRYMDLIPMPVIPPTLRFEVLMSRVADVDLRSLVSEYLGTAIRVSRSPDLDTYNLDAVALMDAGWKVIERAGVLLQEIR